MARGKRKVSTEVMDAKIEQQKAALEKAKMKYDAEKEELAHLIKTPQRDAEGRIDGGSHQE
jgi:hypothetical protein